MELEYVYSESTKKPDEIAIGKTTVYFRKDITTEERTMGDDTQTYYVYKEAKMPIADFRAMANDQALVNALKGVNDSEKTANIETKVIDNEDNQLIIMEAIADLYDAIAMVAGGMS